MELKMSKKDSVYHVIWKKEIRKRTPIYCMGLIFHATCSSVNLFIPIIIGKILDLLMQGADKEIIFKQIIYLLLSILVLTVGRMLYRTCYFSNGRAADTKLRKKVVEHLQNVKPKYFETEERGTFLAYVTHELLMARKSFGNLFFEGGRFIMGPILCLTLVGSTINPYLALSVLPLFPLLIWYMVRQYKKLNEKLENSRQVYIELSKAIEQNTSCFPLIKLYNQQENQKQHFNEVNQQTKQADYEIGEIKNKISNGMNILFASTHIVGFVFGLFLIYKQKITIGDLTAYIGCIEFALGNVIKGIPKFLNGLGLYKQTRKRYNYFYHLDTYSKEGKDLKEIKEIEVKNLTYAYDMGKPVLRNISFNLKKGEKIAFIGQVGSGKTTLMNILSGLYEIPDGALFINGIEANQYKRDDIFKNIGYAMQKNIILDTNIQENIVMNDNVDNQELEKAMIESEFKYDMEQMEDGLETVLKEEGSRLSGGQKQRISVARSLYHMRQINIFDDTLSALDIETEEKVMQNILEKAEENTIIVISNRVSYMDKFDRIYVLIDGQIQDYGTHQELMGRNSFYQEIASYEKEGELV